MISKFSLCFVILSSLVIAWNLQPHDCNGKQCKPTARDVRIYNGIKIPDDARILVWKQENFEGSTCILIPGDLVSVLEKTNSGFDKLINEATVCSAQYLRDETRVDIVVPNAQIEKHDLEKKLRTNSLRLLLKGRPNS